MSRNDRPLIPLSNIPACADRNAKPQAAVRLRKGQHRERDFGIGYGNSSGYGSAHRYTNDWAGAPRFRCG